MEPQDYSAYDAHYQPMQPDLNQAMHEAFEEVGMVTLDTDKVDFMLGLWKAGYCITPIKPALTPA